MKFSKSDWLGLGFVLLGFAAAALYYHRLPNPVPVHWDVQDRANGFMAKPWGAFVLPLTMAGTYVLLLTLPALSPRGYEMGRFRGAFEGMRLAILGLLLVVNLAALLRASGTPVPLGRVLPTAVGVLFVILGNLMGKLTKNFFVGIRTPWTLTDDEVWLRTHRLAGFLTVAAGLALMLVGLIGGDAWGFHVVGPWAVLIASLVVAVIPAGYSYFLYRRLHSPS